jgi:hypothetical protein
MSTRRTTLVQRRRQRLYDSEIRRVSLRPSTHLRPPQPKEIYDGQVT